MFRLQSKITSYTNSQENLNLSKKRRSTDANNEVPRHELELSDKDFKVAILKILQEAIMNMIKISKKIESLIKESVNKERENKKNQMETLELRNTITKEEGKLHLIG